MTLLLLITESQFRISFLDLLSLQYGIRRKLLIVREEVKICNVHDEYWTSVKLHAFLSSVWYLTTSFLSDFYFSRFFHYIFHMDTTSFICGFPFKGSICNEFFSSCIISISCKLSNQIFLWPKRSYGSLLHFLEGHPTCATSNCSFPVLIICPSYLNPLEFNIFSRISKLPLCYLILIFVIMYNLPSAL